MHYLDRPAEAKVDGRSATTYLMAPAAAMLVNVALPSSYHRVAHWAIPFKVFQH